MVEKTVTDASGQTRRVVAEDDKALNEIAAQVEKQHVANYPDINVPVRKGHDLLAVDADANLVLADGTGAHNSPRDAVRDDGSVEGDPNVPVVVPSREPAVAPAAQKLTGDGKLSDLTASDKEKAAVAQSGGEDLSVPTDTASV